MDGALTQLYVYGWPGPLGGASTKLADFLTLTARSFHLTVVPPHGLFLADSRTRGRLERLGVSVTLASELPPTIDGWAVVFCNSDFITDGQVWRARERGLRVVWSNEVMMPLEAELGALTLGLIDQIHYVSPVQRARLEPPYLHALGADGAASSEATDPSGLTRGSYHPFGREVIEWFMTGNFIDARRFPFRGDRPSFRPGTPLTVGRLSRADPEKFPDDFPNHYDRLGLKSPRFRVMGWGPELMGRWPEYSFDRRWELIPELGEPTGAFLRSLDLFVYDLGPRFDESWGRVAVEAMLSGAVPLVPADSRHHLHRLVEHGVTGFHCRGPEDFGFYARQLEGDRSLLREMSARGRRHALRMMSPRIHLGWWKRALGGDGLMKSGQVR